MHTLRSLGSPLSSGGFGFGGLTKNIEKELLIEARQVAVEGDGEQLVGEIHEDAIVASGMLDERGLELVGHEARIAGGQEQVLEAGEELLARGIIEHEPPTDTGAEGQKLGGAQAFGEASVAGEDDTEQLP